MATEKFANNAQTTLSAAISSGATTITVTTCPNAPASGQFRILIDTEILLVTTGGNGSTSWTVTRGQESTSAAAHANGAVVTVILTKGALDQFIADNVQTGGYASFTTEKAGRLYLPTNTPWLLRDTGSGCAAWGPLYPFTQPPAANTFTWVNQGGATISDARGVLEFYDVGAASQTNRLLVKTASAAPYTLTIALLPLMPCDAGYSEVGLCFRNSSSGKLASWCVAWRQDSTTTSSFRGPYFHYAYWTATSTFSAEPFMQVMPPMSGVIWLRIADDSTNRTYWYSTDGLNFSKLYSEIRSNNFTADQVGLFIGSSSATTTQSLGMTVLSYG